ncbi:MAG TPA: MlaD family protein [Sphingomicrobium sp.]|nr:MlaD family protein [Sphingomicrobium sp.]
METRSNYILVGAVTLAMLVGVLAFTVWLAGLSGRETKCYDIYFAQAVGGLNRGSAVSYSGVPVGQITQISLMPQRPEFVHVKIEVQEETPVVRGTTAEIRGVGFTGVSEIQLTGGARGAQPLTQTGPQGCPVIPSSTSGLGALLSNAPELMERIQRLTERMTELLSDQNQNAISDILENVRQTTAVLSERAPEFAAAVADARIAARNAGIAAERFATLAETTNTLMVEEGRPAAQDLRQAIAAIESAATNLDAMIGDARPGVQQFTTGTLPELNRLVRDMQELTRSLKGVSERVEQEGIGGAVGREKLPDYEPRNR